MNIYLWPFNVSFISSPICYSTPPGKRVQTINPPGSEVGPGADGAVATWGISTADKADTMGYNEK